MTQPSSSPPVLKRVEVQGHRGCRGLRPENTIAAFHHAAALGVDAVELDVGLTRDGVLVVAHDPEINPVIWEGSERLPSRRLRDLTLAELKTLDCGSRRHPDFPEQVLVPGERAPALEEVLDLVAAHPRLRVNIEIKTLPERPELTWPPGDFARALVALLEERQLWPRVTVQSFDARPLVAVSALAPQAVIGALVERRQEAEPMLRATRAHYYAPRYTELGADDVERMQRQGLRVIPWTVNEPAEMERLLGWGVDGIITDYPDRLLALLG